MNWMNWHSHQESYVLRTRLGRRRVCLVLMLPMWCVHLAFSQFVPITASGTVEMDSLASAQPGLSQEYSRRGDPVPGIDIALEQIPGGIIARDTTGSSGSYSFTISSAGTYRIQATPPASSTVAFPPETAYTFTAVSGVNQTNLNFRLRFAGATGQDNWAYFASGTNLTLRTVTCWNPDTCIAAGEGGIILRTLDGGRTWTRVDSNGVLQQSGGPTLFVENHNSSRSNKTLPVAVIVGDNGQIKRTTNYGATWTTITSPTAANLNGITDDKDNYSDNVAYAVGDSGTILKSTNNGLTWIMQTSPTTNRLRTVTFWNPDTGIAAGDGGVILRTLNGGATWIVLPDSSIAIGAVTSPLVENHNSSRSNRYNSANPGGGVLTGDLNPIYRTTDFGANWNPIPTSASSSKGYISGKGGDGLAAVGDGGAVLLSSDNGVTWTPQMSRTTRNINSVGIKEEGTNLLGSTSQITQAIIVGDDGTVGVIVPPGFSMSQPGPSWCRGTSHTITWSGGNPGWSVLISLIDVNAWTVHSSINANTSNDGNEVWNIPSTIPPGTYQIYVQEVNGLTWSYSASFVISACALSGQVLLSMDSVSAQLSDSVLVPVRVVFPEGNSYSSAEVSFAGFQQQGLIFLGIDTTGTLIGQARWLLQTNNTDTLLVTASAGAQSISGSGILFKLKFQVSGGSCSFVPINIARALFDTGLDTVRTSNGGVFVQPVPHYGDVDENGLIQAYDASKILQHLAHMDTLGCQGLANANVSNDTTVSALDASLILMYVVGVIDTLPYDTTIVAAGNIAMVEHSAAFGDTVEVQIYLTGGSNIVSFEGLITFDPSRLMFTRIQWSTFLSNFTMQSREINGELYIAGASTAQNGSMGVFATMYFVNAQTVGSTDITFRRLRWNEGAVRESVAVATVVTGVSDGVSLPTEFSLGQSYPNPFNPGTTIKYGIPKAGQVTLKVFDLLGREVVTLVEEEKPPGTYTIRWDASGVASGVYLYRLQSAGFVDVKKMVVLR